MPSVSFSTFADYKYCFEDDVGGLIFANRYYDCSHNVDKVKLRKDFKTELAGKRIYSILIETTPGLKQLNTLVKYKSPSVAEKDQEGAFQKPHEHPQIAEMWWTNHPMGDVIVVYLEPKPKEIKVEGVPTKAELKTLRKEWRDLEEDYDACYRTRPRCYSGQVIVDEERNSQAEQEYEDEINAIKKNMFERATVLIQHDTPFIQRKMTLWARRTASVHFVDGKWQPCLGCRMPSYLE